jgi:hypothetical protein
MYIPAADRPNHVTAYPAWILGVVLNSATAETGGRNGYNDDVDDDCLNLFVSFSVSVSSRTWVIRMVGSSDSAIACKARPSTQKSWRGRRE